MPKRTVANIDYDSLVQPDMLSLNNYIFVCLFLFFWFFGLKTDLLGIWGRVIYHW